MFFPIGTDHDGRRRVVAVPTLIGLNLAAFLAMRAGAARLWLPRGSDTHPIEAWLQVTAFDPGHLQWWQWLTALFTHDPGGIWHLAGNMIFLWAFGKPVESHIGSARFLLLYLLGGIASLGAHALASGNPAIGASGATAATAGLFLALFPRSHTKVLFLIGMSIMLVPSVWLIGLYVAIDLVDLTLNLTGLERGRVANAAHLGGYAFGLAAGLLLLRLGIVPRSDWDLLTVIKQWRRRAALKSAVKAGGSPWSGGPASGRVVDGRPLDASAKLVAEWRALIQARLAAKKFAEAAEAYAKLLELDPNACLPRDVQLELANRTLADGNAAIASRAYANLLSTYPGQSDGDRLRLLVATLAIRRLGDPERGRAILVPLRPKLRDASDQALADALLTECRT